MRTDSARPSRKSLDYLANLGAQFHVSYPVPLAKARMVAWTNERKYWQPALDLAGEERANAWVVNATDVPGLTDHPEGHELVPACRAPGPWSASNTLGSGPVSVTAFLTNSRRWHGPTLDVRHWARSRCENRIKTLKTHAWASCRSSTFWANIATLAMNLASWLQQPMLPTGHESRGWDVKHRRYRLFATAGKLITWARKTWLLIPETAPETGTITTVLKTIKEISQQRRK